MICSQPKPQSRVAKSSVSQRQQWPAVTSIDKHRPASSASLSIPHSPPIPSAPHKPGILPPKVLTRLDSTAHFRALTSFEHLKSIDPVGLRVHSRPRLAVPDTVIQPTCSGLHTSSQGPLLPSRVLTSSVTSDHPVLDHPFCAVVDTPAARHPPATLLYQDV